MKNEDAAASSFTGFLAKIARVPKREIDEQEARYQRERVKNNPPKPAKPGQIIPTAESPSR